MNTSEYLAFLGALENSNRTLLCGYCGYEIASIGKSCICTNCESPVFSARREFEARNHTLLEALDSIAAYARDRRYDDAIAGYEKLIALNKDPYLMHAEALLYLQYSNYELAKIQYDRPGFMEENALHRDKSAKLASSSKRLLAKGISAAESEISNGNNSSLTLYSLFLCQMRLEDYRGAQESLKELKSGPKYLSSYASMLFHIGIGHYDAAIADAETLLNEKSFSVNALFYIGFSKFKKGQARDAKKILSALSRVLSNESVEALLKEIAEQEST
ncbi:MAG: hypothetical protein ABSE71_01645 [Candidatus Micrarchaeaceae archaeon]|jgi:tetratricopeptide (TPR) repeat protein|nr:hypothetical protein [Candidatus Micrarchaeota archaeon]HII10156.1 hypothetical protein [Candidatus Micrarchaeota archaeon]